MLQQLPIWMDDEVAGLFSILCYWEEQEKSESENIKIKSETEVLQ